MSAFADKEQNKNILYPRRRLLGASPNSVGFPIPRFSAYTMNRLYHYIGPRELLGTLSERHHIQGPQDVLDWISQTKQRPENGMVTATFIINAAGQLWVADRRSEHVACAAGQPVLSAGEMTFALDDKQVSVAEASNQSLGYCPEPSSWPAISAALDDAGLSHPTSFTNSYLMRRCEKCQTKNIVKDGIYVCGVCQSPLPPEWNF